MKRFVLARFTSDVTEADAAERSPQDLEDEHIENAIVDILTVATLLGCIFVAYSIITRKFNKYFPESAAFMIIGAAIGVVLRWTGMKRFHDEFIFQPETFYFMLLPPIIFEAGFSMNNKNFFLNMGSILSITFVGTFTSAMVVGYGLYGLSKLHLVKLGLVESLMFGALISATDPVATLSIMGSPDVRANHLVYSLVFGESVLNDAVSIVLFRSFMGYTDGSSEFGAEDLLICVGKFGLACIGSLLIGLVVGLASALLFKHSKHLSSFPHYELSCMLMFAYTSYLLSELAGLSGVVSLFLTGVIMKHYCWYQLSEQSQVSTHEVFKTAASLSETVVFLYLGVGLTSMSPDWQWDPVLMACALVVVILSRACNIFPLCFIANLKRKKKITFKMQLMLWFSGLRGAVAFALALNVRTEHRGIIITTTLFIVLFTTLIMGTATAPILKALGLQEPLDGEMQESAELSLLGEGAHRGDVDIDTKPSPSEDDGEESLIMQPRPSVSLEQLSRASGELMLPEPSPQQVSYVHRKWRLFDELFMKPLFGGQPRAQHAPPH